MWNETTRSVSNRFKSSSERFTILKREHETGFDNKINSETEMRPWDVSFEVLIETAFLLGIILSFFYSIGKTIAEIYGRINKLYRIHQNVFYSLDDSLVISFAYEMKIFKENLTALS